MEGVSLAVASFETKWALFPQLAAAHSGKLWRTEELSEMNGGSASVRGIASEIFWLAGKPEGFPLCAASKAAAITRNRGRLN
jgi:hypothetical protein